MGVYDRQIATAKRLIAAKGEACIWRKVINTADEDPANPGPGTSDDHDVIIAFLPNIQIRLGSSLQLEKGSDVASGALYGLMGQVDFAPSLRDTIIRGSSQEEYGIVDNNGLDELNVNGESILWTIKLTR